MSWLLLPDGTDGGLRLRRRQRSPSGCSTVWRAVPLLGSIPLEPLRDGGDAGDRSSWTGAGRRRRRWRCEIAAKLAARPRGLAGTPAGCHAPLSAPAERGGGAHPEPRSPRSRTGRARRPPAARDAGPAPVNRWARGAGRRCCRRPLAARRRRRGVVVVEQGFLDDPAGVVLPRIQLPPVHLHDVVADFLPKLFFRAGRHPPELLDEPGELGATREDARDRAL